MLILTYESISELNWPFQEINMYVEPQEQELQAHYKHYLLFEWLILKLSIHSKFRAVFHCGWFSMKI